MTLGQKVAMTNLAFGYHLNANSEDFAGGLDQDGTDTDISYAAATGILGPAAVFNGTSSKIALGNSDLNTPLVNGSFTFSCLLKPITGFVSLPILSRGSASTAQYYGVEVCTITTTGLWLSRHIGTSTPYNSVSGAYTFNIGTLYLLGVTYNKTNGACRFYIYPIRPGGPSLVTSGATQSTSNAVFHASYDQGYHLGARLRNYSPNYGKGILSEVLIFADIKNDAWFSMYAAQLRGLLDWE